MGFQKGIELTFKYTYDFAVLGGAVGDLNLTNALTNALEAGLVISSWTLYVETALTSGGSATVTMGNAGDKDGYSVDFFAAGAANAILNNGGQAGALTWDDTNDHPIHYRIDSAANAAPSITIGTAALTAGKFHVYFKAYRP